MSVCGAVKVFGKVEVGLAELKNAFSQSASWTIAVSWICFVVGSPIQVVWE